MFSWFINNLLWTAGIYVVLALVVLMGFSFFIYPKLFWILIPLFVFCFYFFRNPERTCVNCEDPLLIVSPADGRVLKIEEIGDQYKISIFLSVSDVHVNWIPTAGKIDSITYRPGKFLVAYHPKSSENNERNSVVISTPSGQTMEVRQIAGLIARRICCWISIGQDVKRGDKFGMIRFGSRIEILEKRDAFDVYLQEGQYVYGGQTIIGKWR